MSPEECTLETRPTDPLRQATVCVTRIVHIKTRQTHELKQDRPQSVSPEECTLKPG